MIGFKVKRSKTMTRKQKRKITVRRKYFRYGIFAVCCYLLFLIATLPASIFVSIITSDKQLARQLNITAVSGTVWSGRAESIQVAGINLGRLKWDLKIFPLILGELSAHVDFKNNAVSTSKISGSGLVTVSVGGELNLNDFSAAFSADSLGPLMYGMPARFSGDVNLHVDEMSLVKGQRINLKSRIVVSNAGLVSPQRIDYGNILIQASPKKMDSQLVLTDQGGALILDGNIQVKGNGLYNINLGMGARNTASADLTNGLRFLGQRDSTGKYRYKTNGKLRNW